MIDKFNNFKKQESYYGHNDFDLYKLDIDFLNEFADYGISELITNINYLNDYYGDLSELFTSLEDSSKYSDVGSNDDRLQFKLLSYSISKDDDYIGDEN